MTLLRAARRRVLLQLRSGYALTPLQQHALTSILCECQIKS